jgi:trigger factor
MVWEDYRKNPGALAGIRAPLFEEKVVDHIISRVKLTDRKVSRDELLKGNDEDATDEGGETAPESVPN